MSKQTQIVYVANELEKLDISIGEEKDKITGISPEERIKALEKEVAELKRLVEQHSMTLNACDNMVSITTRAYEAIIDDMKIRCKCGKLK